MSLNKCTHVLFVILTAVIINLTVVSTAYAAAKELPKPTPNPPAANEPVYRPNPPPANDPIYNPKPSRKLPNFKKVAKDILRSPTKARKYLNPWAWAGQAALDTLVNQVGKLIDSAGEVQYKDKNGQPVDADHPDAEASGYSRTDSNHPGAYPYEFAFDGRVFSTAEEAHQYIIREYLTKRGLKRTRRNDGLYYDRLDIYYGRGRTSTLFESPVGYFVSTVQSDRIQEKNCVFNRCGILRDFSGEILYKGELSEKNVEVTQEHLVRQLEDLLKKSYKEDSDSKSDSKEEESSKEESKSDSKKDKDKKDEFKLEFPRFCDWAAPVCDFIDWFKKEPPDFEKPKSIPKANLSELGLKDNIDEKRIDFAGVCPTKEMTFTIKGQTIHETIPMYYFCNLLERIAPWLVAFTYLSCGIFVVRSV